MMCALIFSLPNYFLAKSLSEVSNAEKNSAENKIGLSLSYKQDVSVCIEC